MKILLVYDVSYPSVEGGGQRRMYEVATRLTGAGHQVDWLCFKTWDEDDLDSRINYRGLDGFRGLYNKSGSRRYLEPVEFLFQLWRAKVNYDDYDVIWSGQWPILHLLIWSVIPSIRKKLVVDWWEYWGSTWFDYSRAVGIFGFFIEKVLVQRLSKYCVLVGISQASVEEMKARVATPENIELIQNGIDASSLQNLGVGAEKNYDLSYIGRLKDHKNIDAILHAIKFIKTRYARDTSIIIIGDGPEREKLKGLTDELEISNLVTFAGSISNNQSAYELLAQGKIFVNPSLKEGGGSITLLEAFGLGLAAITFRSKDGIDPELVGHGIRGSVLDIISYEELGMAINNLLQSPERLADYTEGSTAFAAKFDWGDIADEYETIFLRVGGFADDG